MYINNSYNNYHPRGTAGWQTGFSILFGIIGGLLSSLGVYRVILAAQALVPPGEYRGLIKLGVVVVLVLVCGTLFLIAIGFAAAVCAILGRIVGSLVGDTWHKIF
jgi:hypothetical protein